jgi:hypothetical protein
MPTPALTRKRTPLDGVSDHVFQEFVKFVRRAAPRWVDGSRSLNRLTLRSAHHRALARSRRRGYCLVDAPVSPVASDLGVSRRRP